jgi:hypothetical protein
MNPFYYGVMRIKGTLYPHKYPPLIAKELFDRCEAVRLGASRPSAIRYSEKPFIFRGIIECAVSGRTVTCDLKKERHVYLICRDPNDPEKKLFVPEETVLAQVKDALTSIRIPTGLLKALLAHMKSSHDAEQSFRMQAIEELRRDHDRVTGRLDTLLDMRLDQSITEGEYDKKAQELKDRQAEIETRITQHRTGDADYRTTLETLISVASRAVQLFERSKPDQKRQLVAFMFSNLRLNGKKLEYSWRSPFDLMVNRPDHTSWLAFLHTVRTSRFEHVMELAGRSRAFAAAGANSSGGQVLLENIVISVVLVGHQVRGMAPEQHAHAVGRRHSQEPQPGQPRLVDRRARGRAFH